ncbi:hypothetical protein JCGZ_23342 [Jatropha curcas]|nr:hypothetical protein JCGZ_23342 [Jatropha curcas]
MEVIREVDLNKMEPWELQERCRIGSTPQNEWYFFSHKDRKYPTGSRTNRATNAGFWKATGRDKCIRNSYKKIGMRKTLVFYRGRAPHGQKTDWIMHEYRLEDADDLQSNSPEDGWVVCRVFKKKNLFKINSNNNEGAETSINSSDQQLNTSNNINSFRNNNNNFMHRDNQFNLLRQNQTLTTTHHHPELSLHYTHMPPTQYSLFQSQNLLPKPIGYDYSPALASSSPVMAAKQLMSNGRDCESAGSESLRYPEAGLEVGTCEPNHHHHHQQQQMNHDHWAMLDRIVTSHDLGNDDSSKAGGAVRFEDGNGSSVHTINQLSLRGEMDFWGYGK